MNDFGSINVDAELVVDVEDGMITLANGCVCCQIRDDLVDSVAALIDRDVPVEYVILEASGVAEPAGIYLTFLDSAYRDRIRLDSVTCVVDADQALADDDPDLVELKLRQIGFADLVVLNKVDLAGADGAAAVKRWIDRNLTRVRIVPAIQCEVALDVLLGVGRREAARVGDDGPHATNHGSMFSTYSYTGGRALCRRSLERMVKRQLPGNVYRCKGFVHLADDPANRYVLQVVGRRVDVAVDRAWGDELPQNRVVAIAHDATLDGTELAALFDSCVAGDPSSVP